MDVEMFFTSEKGNVVGSERVLPMGGLSTGDGKFAIDGVQYEIQPKPEPCRANLINNISSCFKSLQENVLKTSPDKYKVSFDSVMDVSPEELEVLCPESRVFGCAPSLNHYRKSESKIRVNPSIYLKRSAGGHIHLSSSSVFNCEWDSYGYSIDETLKKRTDVLVPVLDIVVANTCVLIDRDESNKERRKVYGKPGEFRVKPYGLEYRSLSNFWLRSCQLTSFVLGLARLAVQIAASKPKNDYADLLIKSVPQRNIIKAIIKNDFDLAMENFTTIRPLLMMAVDRNYQHHPISKETNKEFDFFVEKVKEHGLKYWFRKDPIDHWVNLNEGHQTGYGFESFLRNTVDKKMKNGASVSVSELALHGAE